MTKRELLLEGISIEVAREGRVTEEVIRRYIESKISRPAFEQAINRGMAQFKTQRRPTRYIKGGLATELQAGPSQQVRVIQRPTQKPILSQRNVQICTLCRQVISAKRQAQESLILIDKFDLCPNCWQHVPREIARTLAYQGRWRTRVRAICKKHGWPW